MKKIILSSIIVLLILSGVKENATAQTWQWAKSAGGPNSDAGYAISTDASGNVFVTGYFYSPSIIFGSTTFINAGGSDIFVVKYDALGNVLWAKSAGGIYVDNSSDISTDASGNVFVTGYFDSPTITFGSITLTNSSYGNIFVVKYDANGNVLWAKSAGGISGDAGYSIATDTSGNVLVTGAFLSPNLTFGSTTLINAGFDDIFVVKYDTNGNVLWAKSANGNAEDWGRTISTDASGNVFVTGYFLSPTITFGSITLTNANVGYNDIFVVKYDASGNVLWAKSEGGTDVDEGFGISTDADGNVFVTGWFYSLTITFGSDTLTNVDTSGNTNDIFLAKYDANGNLLWAKSADGTSFENSIGIATDAGGNVFVTGYFNGPSIIFGSTTLINTNTIGNIPDIFFVKYDASGNVLWAKSAGGTSPDYGFGISTAASGNVFVTGWFQSSTISFGSTTLTNVGAGYGDMFVAKLDNITGIADDSYREGKGITIYPNPTKGNFTISFKGKIVKGNVEIQNILGENVLRENIFNESKKEINLKNVSQGIYFVKVNDGEKSYCKKITVVQN